MSAPPRAGAGPSLGVVVPCRNEAAVIERKVLNLARARWPAGEGHRLVLVDDGSDDGTAGRVRRALATLAGDLDARGVEAILVANDVRPGKPGAVRAGIRAAEGTELLVLTDADVIVAPDALVALAQAFAARPALAMASGAQRFVASLAEDGRAAAADGGPVVDAAGAFDRWTARVRRLESRAGRLFSVHGQLLAWRASLALAPAPGVAADDIDLMLQVRSLGPGRPARVELVREAVFLEVKSRGARSREQDLRRAQAYVQVVRAWDGRPAARGLQWRFYRHAPLAAPALTAALAVLAPAAGLALAGPPGAACAAALALAAAATPAGRGWLRLVRRIREAARSENARALPERWEMARR